MISRLYSGSTEIQSSYARHVERKKLSPNGALGTDLKGPGKNPIVLAHTGGTVLHVVNYVRGSELDRNGYGYGNHVLIQTESNVVMAYCHLKSTDLKVGQRVAKNEPIGFEGNTGHSTGDHLHFEIRVYKEAISAKTDILGFGSFAWLNPEPYLNADYPEAVPEQKVSSAGYWIQCGSYGVVENAYRMQERLNDYGIDALLYKKQGNTKVVVGPYADMVTATKAMKSKIISKGISCYITTLEGGEFR